MEWKRKNAAKRDNAGAVCNCIIVMFFYASFFFVRFFLGFFFWGGAIFFLFNLSPSVAQLSLAFDFLSCFPAATDKLPE